nr:hypothetical protein [Nonomuraea diastatica]
MIDDEISHYGVELFVLERQVGQRGRPYRRVRVAAGDQLQHAGIGVDGGDLGAQRERRRRHHAGAAADVQQLRRPGLAGRSEQGRDGVRAEAGEPALVRFVSA